MYSEIEKLFLKGKLILRVEKALSKIHRFKWGRLLEKKAKNFTRVSACRKRKKERKKKTRCVFSSRIAPMHVHHERTAQNKSTLCYSG